MLVDNQSTRDESDPGIYFFMIKNRYLLIGGVACCYDSDTLVDLTITGQEVMMWAELRSDDLKSHEVSIIHIIFLYIIFSYLCIFSLFL